MIFDFEQFHTRHIGPNPSEREAMLRCVRAASLDALIEETIPSRIRLSRPLDLPEGKSEYEFLRDLRAIAAKNRVFRSYIGLGYSDCVTPSVILRNVLENPGWYTPYTPYQAEIAQGRLEALLNFQTMVKDLTAIDVAKVRAEPLGIEIVVGDWQTARLDAHVFGAMLQTPDEAGRVVDVRDFI